MLHTITILNEKLYNIASNYSFSASYIGHSTTSSKVVKCSVKDSKRSSEVLPGTEKPRTAKRLLNLKSETAAFTGDADALPACS